MTKDELGQKFLDIDLKPLEYILDIVVNGSKCIRDDKEYADINKKILNTLLDIENLRLGYEDSQ